MSFQKQKNPFNFYDNDTSNFFIFGVRDSNKYRKIKSHRKR